MEDLKDDYAEEESLMQYAIVCPVLVVPHVA
jgi:hypothetical protein